MSQAENERLKKEVEDLKQQLIDVETMNGRKQFMPQPKKETCNSAPSKPVVTPVAAPPVAPASSAKAEKKKVFLETVDSIHKKKILVS